MQTTHSSKSGQYLSFFVGGEEYGVHILHVREIIEYEVVTRVPGTPAWIRGVINLRGTVVPVVDLKVKFGLSAGETSNRSCIVMVELEYDGALIVMGILCDAISQVTMLDDDDIEPPPAFGTRVRVDFLHGMSKVEKKFVLLLDIDKVLTTDDLTQTVSAVTQGEQAEDSTTGTSQYSDQT